MDRINSLTRVVILGSTGSIGRSALSMIDHDGGARLRAWGLSAHSRWRDLAAQAVAHRPRFVTLTDPELARVMEREVRGTGVEVLAGMYGMVRMVRYTERGRVL